ncbi:MAG: hypothetical protein GY753_09750 [Gammaproteobacteria bacterium]|nr:hypothetical protein [Gammaproteobacteria bacterium]
MCGGGGSAPPPAPPPKVATRGSRVVKDVNYGDNAAWRATLLTGDAQEGSLGLSDEELDKADRSLLG